MKEREWMSMSLIVNFPVIHPLLLTFKALKGIGILHTGMKPENIMLVNHKDQPSGWSSSSKQSEGRDDHVGSRGNSGSPLVSSCWHVGSWMACFSFGLHLSHENCISLDESNDAPAGSVRGTLAECWNKTLQCTFRGWTTFSFYISTGSSAATNFHDEARDITKEESCSDPTSNNDNTVTDCLTIDSNAYEDRALAVAGSVDEAAASISSNDAVTNRSWAQQGCVAF